MPNSALSRTGGGGSGDVAGPASSTDNAIARYDLTTGKLLQNSLITISDAGALFLPAAGFVGQTGSGGDLIEWSSGISGPRWRNLDGAAVYLSFGLSGLSADRTATWPDSDLTVTGISTTQTLSNKTYAAPSITGSIIVERTITAAGTTGAQTINKPAGTVNIAAAGTSVVVTNSLVTADSIVFVTVRTADATARVTSVVPAAGSFTINTVAVTVETSFGFLVTN